MDREVRVAVVGVGRWGRNIVRAFKELEAEGLVRLEAVVDAELVRAKLVAREYGVPKYFMGVEGVVGSGCEAAAVAVPIDRLVEVSKSLAGMGVNVFVEKPVSMRPEEIVELRDVALSAGVVVQPGFIVRFDPVSRGLKELMPGVGRPKYVAFKRLSRRPKHMRRFPIVFDLMIHDIDLTQYLLGRGEWVVRSINVIESESGVAQTLQVTSRYGDTFVDYIVDGNLPVKIREVELIAGESFIKADYVGGSIAVKKPKGVRTLKASGEEPLKAELRAFIERVNGREVAEAPTLEDAYRVCKTASEILSMEGTLKAGAGRR